MKLRETITSTILAIETAIGGGSISILQNGIEIGSIDSGVSRAEEVLVGIRTILADCELTVSEIDMIAAPLGPGSFTGIRICLATGLGLARSLSAKLVSVNALDAMSLLAPNKRGIVVLPLGRGNYALQEFGPMADPGSRPSVVNEGGLIRILDNRAGLRFIFHKDLGVVAAKRTRTERFSVSTESLATLIGRWAYEGRGTAHGQPLYLRNEKVGV